MKKAATAFAPATTGNVGVGFDVLGLALQTVGDTVTVTKTDKRGIVEIEKINEGFPLDPEKNTATAGLIALIKDFNLEFGFRVKIKKGIPLGSGMGGSAASAVASVVAANALLKKRLEKKELLHYALIGESVASGSTHGDNVAPCLFGGLVLLHHLDVIPLPFPSALTIVIVLPNAQVKTKDARGVLKTDVSLKDFVTQSAHLAGFISGCFQKNLKLIEDSFKDIIIEPQRAHLIPGFYEVKTAALRAGAIGYSISGAGPAVFAIAKKSDAPRIKKAMVSAFNAAGAGPARGWVSPINKKGAHLL
jgi:homoserine kinase